MTSRIWIGGGTNSVYQAGNWAPAGTPQPGDMLSMYSGTANMAGGNLAGDTLYVGTQTSFAANTPPAVVNLSDGASLTAVAATTAFTEQSIVFNTSGFDSLNLTVNNNYYATMTTTVNIAAYSLLRGTVAIGGHNGDLTINGAGLSAFDNDGASSVGYNCVAAIDANVLGIGSFTVSGDAGLSFLNVVGPRQTVDLLGLDSLNIGNPHAFFGQVDVANAAAPFSIGLDGITNADSYCYTQDMLTLFRNDCPINVLRLSDAGSFAVAQTPTGVFVGSSSEVPPGAVLLPQHGAAAPA
ncbi:MAG TPA: hypothetical protein VMB73_22305 [Acetobacteraceae bacterium]|jgi:hypothetical protein|nr:hypothetical protein [Acetobacteraceae bacterium]